MSNHLTRFYIVQDLQYLLMSGYTKLWVVAVAAWLVWTTTAYEDNHGAANYLCLPTQKDNCSISSAALKDKYKVVYPTVSYITGQFFTKEKYTNFIETLRSRLENGGDRVYDIARLRNPSTVPISQRFVMVQLSLLDQMPITLAIDVTNVYVIGYSTGTRFYFFNDANVDTASIFPEITTRNPLPFLSSYPALEAEAGSRETVSLGMIPLWQSVEDLREYRRNDLARSFLVVIQMVAEAARFPNIEGVVRSSINVDGSTRTFRPTAAIIDLENNWRTISSSIQQSTDGNINPPVVLLNYNGQQDYFSTVDSLRPKIKIIIFVSIPQNPWSQFSKPVVLTSIIGFRDLCLQANDGNTVWIEECVSNKIAQEWAIYPDGSIRPNENKDKCLTWELSTTWGKVVVIGTCDEGPRQRWLFGIDGSVSNVVTGLVLDVMRSDLSLGKIVVRPFSGTANQIWYAGLLGV